VQTQRRLPLGHARAVAPSNFAQQPVAFSDPGRGLSRAPTAPIIERHGVNE
jgi:hypothetical protein